MHIGNIKMDSVHEYASEQLRMMFTKCTDPDIGVVVRAECEIDGVQYSSEEPVEETFPEEIGLRLSMHRCIRRILDDARANKRN